MSIGMAADYRGGGVAGRRETLNLPPFPTQPDSPMFPRDARIEGFDPELAAAIAGENRRQEDHVELIASENYASPRVMEAQGSRLTNKYAEGYPGKRYYGGCEFVDVAERLAIERCKQLFGADYANVQPHSGSQANQAVYLALLNPGDTILGMCGTTGARSAGCSPCRRNCAATSPRKARSAWMA